MSTFNCCLCCQPANKPPDEFKAVLTNLIQFFSKFKSCRVNCLKLEKLMLCKSCWIFFLRVRQLDYENRLKTEICDAKKAFLSLKIRRAQQSLVDSANPTSCKDSGAHISATTNNDDSYSDLGGQSLHSDAAESISCSLKNTDESDDEPLKSCKTAKVINKDSEPVAASLAEEQPTEVTSNDTSECDSESQPPKHKTRIDHSSITASSPEKEPTEATSTETTKSDSESQPPKTKTIMDNVPTSASSPEREPAEATSTDTSDTESDWEPAKRKSRVRTATSASRQEKEETESTSEDSSDSNSEPEPDKEIQRKYKCRFCPKLYVTAPARSDHVRNHHSQQVKKELHDRRHGWRKRTDSGEVQGDEGTSGTDVWPPKGIVIPADTPSVKRISLNKFTYHGKFQFEGTDFGFKCLSCTFLTKFTTTNNRNYVWFNMVTHIREWHLDATKQAAKKHRMPQTNTVEIAPNRFLHGGIPFNKLENDEYECGDCGFRPVVNPQKSNKNILKHILLKHLQASEEYICEICGNKLKSVRSLRVHKRIHVELTEDQLHSCSECKKKFKSKDELHSHKKRVHGGEDAKKLICEMCGKRFGTAMQLEAHKFSHTGVRTYKCSECGKMFAAYAALNTHQRSHKGKKYTCDVCGMDFTQHYSVTRHKKTAHPQ